MINNHLTSLMNWT